MPVPALAARGRADGNQRDMRRPVDQMQITVGWLARLRVVHGEGSKHLIISSDERLGPGGTQSVTEREASIIGEIE